MTMIIIPAAKFTKLPRIVIPTASPAAVIKPTNYAVSTLTFPVAAKRINTLITALKREERKEVISGKGFAF